MARSEFRSASVLREHFAGILGIGSLAYRGVSCLPKRFKVSCLLDWPAHFPSSETPAILSIPSEVFASGLRKTINGHLIPPRSTDGRRMFLIGFQHENGGVVVLLNTGRPLRYGP